MPLVCRPLCHQIQSLLLVSVPHSRKLICESSGQHQSAATAEPIENAPALLDQQVVNQVCANNVELPPRADRKRRQIVPGNCEFDPVDRRILSRNTDRIRIEIERCDRRIAKLRCRDGYNPRSRTDIEQRLSCLRVPQGGDLLQTETGRRMVAGAKAQAGIEDHDRPAALRPAFAPTRKNENSGVDFQRLEMALPGMSPVLAPDPASRNASRTEVQSGLSNRCQGLAQKGTMTGIESTKKYRCGRGPVFKVRVNGCRLPEFPGERFGDSVFRFRRNANGNLPQWTSPARRSPGHNYADAACARARFCASSS